MAPSTGPAADREPPCCSHSDEWDLAARRLQPIAAFHHTSAIAAWAAAAGQGSREMRQQDTRRLEVLRRKHQAVIERAHEQLRSSGVRPAAARRRRVVLADRRPSDGVVAALEGHGIRVVAQVDDGADAVGIAVVEQPDVVVVREPLGMVASEEVVRDVRRYSPRTGIVALAVTRERARACAAAGATVVLPGQVPIPDLVSHLLRMVEQRHAAQA